MAVDWFDQTKLVQVKPSNQWMIVGWSAVVQWKYQQSHVIVWLGLVLCTQIKNSKLFQKVFTHFQNLLKTDQPWRSIVNKTNTRFSYDWSTLAGDSRLNKKLRVKIWPWQTICIVPGRQPNSWLRALALADNLNYPQRSTQLVTESTKLYQMICVARDSRSLWVLPTSKILIVNSIDHWFWRSTQKP